MNIGILTHCLANNFGANLQALSTGFYVKNRGHHPIYICWTEYLKSKGHIDSMMPEQMELHSTFLERNGFEVSRPCVSDEDFSNLVKERDIKAIIVGADAVLTVKPWLDGFIVGRKGIRLVPIQDDYKFPNPFWLPFLTDNKVKRFLMSPSCQSSNYKGMSKAKREGMRLQLEKFDYISARDQYTQKMIFDLTKGKISCPITPDPVFNFQNNVPISYTKEQILAKFKLPNNYILVSFFDYSMPQKKWFQEFKVSAKKSGFECVHLPMPECPINMGLDYEVQLPLDPLDWYHLIKYASGYVGNNMHPIIVSIVNKTPFFSLDQHGKYALRGKIQRDKTGKVYELLNSLGLLDYRIANKYTNSFSTDIIIDKIKNFDTCLLEAARDTMSKKYQEMMNEIFKILETDEENINS